MSANPEAVAARLTAMLTAMNVMVRMLDEAGVVQRAEFVERLDASLERIGEDASEEARQAMADTANLFRASGPRTQRN